MAPAHHGTQAVGSVCRAATGRLQLRCCANALVPTRASASTSSRSLNTRSYVTHRPTAPESVLTNEVNNAAANLPDSGHSHSDTRRTPPTPPTSHPVLPLGLPLHSSSSQFFTQRNHAKQCSRCGKPNLLTLERCNYCNLRLHDGLIKPVTQDHIMEAIVNGKKVGDEVGLGTVKLKTWELMAVETRWPVGKHHLLVFPKSTFPDLRACGRRDQKALKSLFQTGTGQLEELYGVKSNFISGFSYPSEFNQLCLHMIVPPIRNFLLFRKSNWFSYHQAQKQIYEQGGIVKRMGEGLNRGGNNGLNDGGNTGTSNETANTRSISAHIAVEIDQKVIELDRKARERKV